MQLKSVEEKQGPIDMTKVDEVFFPLMTYVGIGDIVFLTGVFKAFKQMGKSVVVATHPSKQFVYEGISSIDKLLIIDPKQPLAKPAHQHTDLIIDLYSRFEEGTLSYYQLFTAIPCQYRIGFNVVDPQLYNLTFTSPSPEAHITDAYQQLFTRLGLPEQNLAYDINIPRHFVEEATTFLNQLKAHAPSLKIIAFNPYASSARRSLSLEQVTHLLQLLAALNDYKIVLLGEPHKMAPLADDHTHVVIAPFNEFWHAAAILAHSDLVISVDSAPVHLANAWQKPLVAIYSSETLNGLPGDAFYAPNYSLATQLIMPDQTQRDMNLVYQAVVERLADPTDAT